MSAQPLTLIAEMAHPPDTGLWSVTGSPFDLTAGNWVSWYLDGKLLLAEPVDATVMAVAADLTDMTPGAHTLSATTTTGQSGQTYVYGGGPGAGMRPTVDEVASLIRARTKDLASQEVGTFNADTRPTDVQVEQHITAAVALVGTRLPAELADEFVQPARQLVAYRAALRIEKSYFPEQVRSDRSAYDQLKAEYDEDLEALLEAIAAGASGGQTTGGGASRIGMLKVGSWTSIRSTDPWAVFE